MVMVSVNLISRRHKVIAIVKIVAVRHIELQNFSAFRAMSAASDQFFFGNFVFVNHNSLLFVAEPAASVGTFIVPNAKLVIFS